MATYQEQRERDYQNKLVKRFVDELDYKLECQVCAHNSIQFFG